MAQNVTYLKHPPRASIIVLRFGSDNSPIFPLNFTGGVKYAKFGQNLASEEIKAL